MIFYDKMTRYLQRLLKYIKSQFVYIKNITQ